MIIKQIIQKKLDEFQSREYQEHLDWQEKEGLGFNKKINAMQIVFLQRWGRMADCYITSVIIVVIVGLFVAREVQLMLVVFGIVTAIFITLFLIALVSLRNQYAMLVYEGTEEVLTFIGKKIGEERLKNKQKQTDF